MPRCGLHSLAARKHYADELNCGVAKRKLARVVTDRMNTIKPGKEQPALRLVA